MDLATACAYAITAAAAWLTATIARCSFASPFTFPDPTGIIDLFRIFVLLKGNISLFLQRRRGALNAQPFFMRDLLTLDKILFVTHPNDHRDVMAAEGKLGLAPGVGSAPTIKLLHGENNLQSLSGKDHQRWRKVLHGILSPRELEAFLPHVLSAMRTMWKRLGSSPSESHDIQEAIRVTQLRLMSKLLYGMDTDLGDEDDLAVFEADFELAQAALFASLKSETFSKGHGAVKRIKERLSLRFSAALEKRRAAIIGGAGADNRQLPAASGGLNAMEVVADMLLSEGTADDEGVLEEAVDHMYLLFEASHGTTMFATTSLLYLLSLPANCQALEGVRAEVNKVMPSGKLSPGLTSLRSEMPFCEGCIKEALRLVPLIGTIEYRIMTKGATLSLRGREVPGLKRLFFNWGNWYEDAAVFDDPGQFVPGRWIDGHEAEAGELAKAVFKPFGMGRHICLGSQLAMLVLKCWLVSFAEDQGRDLLFDENATRIVNGIFPEKRVDGFKARVGMASSSAAAAAAAAATKT